MGYTKLFSSIVASTIWREPHHIRLLWITMLAMKDERHIVESSVPSLADFARITRPECEEALKVLASPDPDSRNQSHQGRRIQKCEGGWLILNGEFYRQKMNDADRKAYKAAWAKQYRIKKKGKPLPGESLNERALRDGREPLNPNDFLKEDPVPYKVSA
jgi:hypothetical protein